MTNVWPSTYICLYLSIYLSIHIGNTHVKYSRRELLLSLPGGSINEAIAKKTSIYGLYPRTAYHITHTHHDDNEDDDHGEEEVMVDIVATTSMEGVLEFTMKYAKGSVVRIVCISSQWVI